MTSMDEHQKKLVWQCRRGIKEVEVLLVPFFERCYATLDDDQKRVFEKMLDQHDVDLFEWFTTRTRPEDAELSAMVDFILETLAS